MRVKWIAPALCVVLALAWAPCLLADDVVGIRTSKPLQIGSLDLEPGSYLLWFSDRYPNNGVVVVMDEERTTILGKAFVRVTGSFGEDPHAATTLLFSGEEPSQLTAIAIGGKTTHYGIPAR